jgi:hypothetical protein
MTEAHALKIVIDALAKQMGHNSEKDADFAKRLVTALFALKVLNVNETASGLPPA